MKYLAAALAITVANLALVGVLAGYKARHRCDARVTAYSFTTNGHHYSSVVTEKPEGC